MCKKYELFNLFCNEQKTLEIDNKILFLEKQNIKTVKSSSFEKKKKKELTMVPNIILYPSKSDSQLTTNFMSEVFKM